jgi:hypothetical protein
MEYFLGCLFTLTMIYIVVRLLKQPKNQIINKSIIHTQSRLHEMVKDFLPINFKPLKTQATEYFESRHIMVVRNEDKVYWIQDKIFYVADIINGQIVEESKKRVDTSGMNKVELDKISFIVDKLTEGKKDDSGNSGK